MVSTSIEEQLNRLARLYITFCGVERTIPLWEDCRENDAEHSFSLALFCWMFLEIEKEAFANLDHAKVLKYALAHDLAEAYAGDVPAIDTHHDKNIKAAKEEAEAAAREQIRSELPSFAELHTTMDAYEKREDPESLFVYVVDKLIPLFVIYQSGVPEWKKSGHNLEKLRGYKDDKMRLIPTLEKYYHHLMVELESRQKELFAL